jgi:hypothetical protein
MKNALVRTSLVVLALCVGAWLAVGYRDVRLENKGAYALAQLRAHHLTPAEARDGLQALRDAQWLNADQTPRLMEGELNVFRGRVSVARAIAKEGTAAEPDNVRGWFLSYLVESGPARREALAQIRRLDPWAVSLLR